jgi:hypothetical protein
MLTRLQAGGAGVLLAKVQKPANLVPQLRQRLIIGKVWASVHDVSFPDYFYQYRNTTLSARERLIFTGAQVAGTTRVVDDARF